MKATQQVVKKYLTGWVGGWMEGWRPCWMDGWMDGLVDGSQSLVKDCLQQSKKEKHRKPFNTELVLQSLS